MARGFDRASLQYLANASAVATGPPFSVSLWFTVPDLDNNYVMFSLANSASEQDYFALLVNGGVAGDYVNLTARDAPTPTHCRTTISTSADTWTHALGVAIDTDDRACYINGGGKGTSAINVTPASIDRMAIGVFYDSSLVSYMAGKIAEVAVWNVALTDADAAILAKGYSPLLVRPQSLVAYWPLIRDTDDDIVGGYSMTPVNSPTVAAHPRVLYPIGPYMVPAAAAIAALRIPRHPAAYYGGPTVF